MVENMSFSNMTHRMNENSKYIKEEKFNFYIDKIFNILKKIVLEIDFTDEKNNFLSESDRNTCAALIYSDRHEIMLIRNEKFKDKFLLRLINNLKIHVEKKGYNFLDKYGKFKVRFTREMINDGIYDDCCKILINFFNLDKSITFSYNAIAVSLKTMISLMIRYTGYDGVDCGDLNYLDSDNNDNKVIVGKSLVGNLKKNHHNFILIMVKLAKEFRDFNFENILKFSIIKFLNLREEYYTSGSIFEYKEEELLVFCSNVIEYYSQECERIGAIPIESLLRMLPNLECYCDTELDLNSHLYKSERISGAYLSKIKRENTLFNGKGGLGQNIPKEINNIIQEYIRCKCTIM